MRHFFGEAAQELTSVEHSKLFHTLRALLFRPGFPHHRVGGGAPPALRKPLNLCHGSAKKVFAKIADRKGVPLGPVLERISDKWQRHASLSLLAVVLVWPGYFLTYMLVFVGAFVAAVVMVITG